MNALVGYLKNRHWIEYSGLDKNKNSKNLFIYYFVNLTKKAGNFRLFIIRKLKNFTEPLQVAYLPGRPPGSCFSF